jgi:hypothetical protein
MYRTGQLEARNKASNGEGTVTNWGYGQVYKDGKQRPSHVVKVEKIIGKPLPKDAQIHHVDGDKLNNSNDNLVVCPDATYHQLLHRNQKALDACGNASYRQCNRCKEWDDPNSMTEYVKKNGNIGSYYHRRKNNRCVK